MELGHGANTDFLGVSFSTLDMVGHGFGPNSHEVQDILARLDLTIGKLLDHLDAKIGKGNYVLALGADHGVAELPEQVKGAGRLGPADIMNAINTALAQDLGPGRYVAANIYTDVYLAPGVAAQLKRDPQVAARVLRALRELPGVAYAFRADDIASAGTRTGKDPVKRAAALSFYAERSGDIIVIPKENWLLAATATTHGTLYPYDQRVPVIFYGAGVKPGQYQSDASPADIAPTLAAIAKVPFKKLDGDVLKDALK
jgi:arylsulfatase A-like enzyme